MSILPHKSKGFTLIEVVIAVAVISIGLIALMKTTGTITRNTAYLNDKTVAMWVAQNAMAEFELGDEGLSKKTAKGSEEMAGITWYWTRTIEETQDPDMRRVEIAVRKDERQTDSNLVTLATLMPTYFENQSP